MKPKEKSLLEWVNDEILFDDTHLSGKTVFTRTEFAVCCAKMRGPKDGVSVPVLQETIAHLILSMRAAGWSDDRASAWLDSFFVPENMLRFTDPYTVKSALERKTKNLRDSSRGTLFNIMK